jgi:hypothetical protein
MKSRILFFLSAGLALAAATALQASDAKVPLKLKLPPPSLVGTPVPIKLPNLESKPADTPNLLVPEGTVNLAAGKTVTASDAAPLLGDASLITDGDKSSDEGCFVEFGPGKQWIQIDLGASSPLFALWISHFHSQARAYKAVVIQVSDDSDFIKGVTTLFNSDFDNSSGLGAGKDPAYVETYRGRLIPVKPEGVKARYVRLYSSGNTTNNLNHYIEVEVYGLPAK